MTTAPRSNDTFLASPKSEPRLAHEVLADAAVLLASAIAAAAILGAIDWAILPRFVRTSSGITGRSWLFYGVLSGYLLVWILIVVSTALALRQVFRRLRSPASTWTPAILCALTPLPFGLWLSDYLLSGPTVQHLKPRILFVLGGTAVSAALLAVSIWPLVQPHASGKMRRFWWVFAIALCFIVAIFILLNKKFLPNEYEPLHMFASAVVILSATGALALMWARVPPGRLGRTKLVLALSVCAVVWSAGALWTIGRRANYAWAVHGESSIARYISLPSLGASDSGATKLLANPELGNADSARRRAESARAPAPNIVLFFIDNLQADHVGAYGYQRRPTTPEFDALAREGAVFTRAYSSYPQTRNYMSSLLTGRFIPSFMKHDFPAKYYETSVTRLLERREYHTFIHGYFDRVPGSLNPKRYSIQTFLPAPTREEEARIEKEFGRWPPIATEEVFQRVQQHLRQAKKLGKPAFVWIHLLRPHWKSHSFAASPDLDFGPALVDKYDSAIAEADRWLGRLRKLAAEQLDLSRTYWVVGSDHGAGLSRGQKEDLGKTLFEDHVRVPLLLAGPKIRVGKYDALVDSSLDLAATILDTAGIDKPPEYDGTSLLPLVIEGLPPKDRTIALLYGSHRGAVGARWKWIEYRRANLLFDIEADPKESINRTDSAPEAVKQFARFANSVLSRRIAAFEHGARIP